MNMIKGKNGKDCTTGDKCKFTTTGNKELKGILRYIEESSSFGFETKDDDFLFVPMVDVNQDTIEEVGEFEYFVSYNYTTYDGTFGFANGFIDSNKKINSPQVVTEIEKAFKPQFELYHMNVKSVTLLTYQLVEK